MPINGAIMRPITKKGYNIAKVKHYHNVRFVKVIRVNSHVRSSNDRRRFVDKHIVEYRSMSNDEHRFAFESSCGESYPYKDTLTIEII